MQFAEQDNDTVDSGNSGLRPSESLSGNRQRKLPYVQLLNIFVLAALFFAYWIEFRAPAFGMFHDDGIYVVTAKALAEGKGYRIISLPAEIAQTKYPPLYPMLLAGAWKLYPHFPQNVPLLKLVSLISAVIWLWLCFLYVKMKSASSNIAWSIVSLTAAASWTVFLAVIPLSEMTFAAFCTGALLMLQSMEQEKHDNQERALLVGLLAAAATLTRTAGFPLIIAAAAILFFQKKFKAAATVLAVSLVLIIPWFWWAHTHTSLPNISYDYYSQANYSNWDLVRNYSWPQKRLVFGLNLIYALIAPAQLLGIDTSHGSLWLIAMLIIGAFVVFGYVSELKTKVNCLNVFLLLYTGVVLLWAWPPTRFFAPVLPFLMLYGYSAFARFLAGLLLLKPGSKLPAWICLAVLIPTVTIPLSLSLWRAQKTGAASPNGLKNDTWDSMTGAFDWIDQNTARDSVVMSTVDPLIYLYTGRKSLFPLHVNPIELAYSTDKHQPFGTPSQIADQMLLNKISYIVSTPNDGFYVGPYVTNSVDKFIDQVTLEHPGAIHLVAVGADPQVRIYKVERNELAAAFGRMPYP
jgi:hypothetical protein